MTHLDWEWVSDQLITRRRLEAGTSSDSAHYFPQLGQSTSRENVKYILDFSPSHSGVPFNSFWGVCKSLAGFDEINTYKGLKQVSVLVDGGEKNFIFWFSPLRSLVWRICYFSDFSMLRFRAFPSPPYLSTRALLMPKLVFSVSGWTGVARWRSQDWTSMHSIDYQTPTGGRYILFLFK
jgi:hypothetical protein